MQAIMLSLLLRLLLAEPTEALVCEVTICCDYCTFMSGSTYYCRGCEGAGGDGCGTGQTSIDCPPSTCYSGNAKLNYGSWGVDACK